MLLQKKVDLLQKARFLGTPLGSVDSAPPPGVSSAPSPLAAAASAPPLPGELLLQGGLWQRVSATRSIQTSSDFYEQAVIEAAGALVHAHCEEETRKFDEARSALQREAEQQVRALQCRVNELHERVLKAEREASSR